MLTWLQMAIIGYLLLVLQGSSAVVETTERRVAAEGSSALMHAPDVKNRKFTEWEYIRNTTPEFILQYYADSPSPNIYPAYKGRVIFYPKNGSILLQRLQEADSGIYKATVDLMRDKTRTTLLEVIKPVPQPELQFRLNPVGLPIELVCMVPEGTVTSISWKKDGHPLPPEKFCLLSENITKLQIRKAEKSDCGSYSCNVSNAISWKEAARNLVVTVSWDRHFVLRGCPQHGVSLLPCLAGLTPPLHHMQKLVVVALMFVAVSTITFVILLCQPRDHSYGEEAKKHLNLSIHGLLCISSLLLLATSIIWMQEKGLSAVYILLGLFSFAAAIATTWVGAAAVWRPAALYHFKSKMWYQVIQSSTALTTLAVDLLFTTLFLYNIQQLHEQGCSEAVDLTVSCVCAATAILIMLLLIFLRYHRNKQKSVVMKNPNMIETTEVMDSLVMEETQRQRQEREQ
ncbi:uncharacterized protein LOC142063050 isoform X2 [Phalacrocorax aristotelis]|uniref:uncharacterized protein LOC142063050 isoform X2 n=2 Tax=Phalacrocorax aristotelis TaxID=126867 RepID=UPI003F4C0CCA